MGKDEKAVARLIEKDALPAYAGDVMLVETTLEISIGIYEMYDGGISFEGLGLENDFDLKEYGETWRIWDIGIVVPTMAELDYTKPWGEGSPDA